MRFFLACVSLLLLTFGAQAQIFPHSHRFPAKFALSGKPVILWEQYSLNPDCTSVGPVRFNILNAPAHGRISVKTTKIYSNFPPNNPRNICNTKGGLGQELIYISVPGYTGPDSVDVEPIGPLGAASHLHVAIVVR